MKAKKVSSMDQALFCEQLSMILKSGMTLAEGIDLLKESSELSNLHEVILQIEQEIIAYKPLHEAIAGTQLFSKQIVHLLEIGFIAGKLEEVLDSLTQYYEREYIIRERIKQSILQPMLLMGLFLVVVGVIVVKVLPVFNQIFIGLGSKMSGFATGLMNMGTFIMSNLMWIVAALLVIGGIIYWSIWYGKINIPESIPRTRSRFTAAMALMIASGISFEQAFIQSKKVINNPVFLKAVEESINGLEQQKRLVELLRAHHIMSSWNIRLLEVADQTGRVEEAMQKVAKADEEAYGRWIERRVSCIEPLFVILFSTLIGGILISVMFPLISIMSSIG